jgi:copper chaperone CopZ
VELLQDISRWLIIGMLVAALLSVIIPDDFFVNGISSEYLAVFMMLLASVPLYICATGSIPIAAVLLMKGLSPGAALVLLMAGPATNIATMAVIGNAMGRRSLWLYLVSIIGGAIAFGILINELIPRQWITGFIPADLHGGAHEHPSGWIKWVSSALLVLLVINGYIQQFLSQRRSRREDREKNNQMKVNIHRYSVGGMTCNHCKATVENGLAGLPEVSEVLADPDNSTVTLQAQAIDDSSIRETLEKLGYTFGGRI